MASSAWGKKLDTKISALSATSSKESIQTLAKWIGFNRKHASSFVQVWENKLTATSSGNEMLPVYIGVIHQVLILDQDKPAKWDKLADLRLALGEMLLGRLQDNGGHVFEAAAVRDKLSTSLKEWDSANVFGGPTLVNQLKRELTNLSTKTISGAEAVAQGPSPSKEKPTTTTKTTKAPAAAAATTTEKKKPAPAETIKPAETKESKAAEKSSDADKPSTENKKESPADSAKTAGTKRKQPSSSSDAATTKPTKAPSSSTTTTRQEKSSSSTTAAVSSSSTGALTYDFDATGIAAAPVEMKQLHDPCKSLATLQIARDLRNDSAQQISSLLAELPQSVRKYIGGEAATVDISEDRARDLSLQTNDAALDLDVDDELSNIRVFSDIVQKQKSARQLLILLLTKSRCQFGSIEAAAAFSTAQRAMGELEKRKQILQDAMELEGAAVEDLEEEEKGEDDDAAAKEDAALTLDWYKPDAEAKKARTS